MHVWTHNIKGTKLEDFQYSERAFLIHVCNSPCNTLPNSMDFYIWHMRSFETVLSSQWNLDFLWKEIKPKDVVCTCEWTQMEDIQYSDLSKSMIAITIWYPSQIFTVNLFHYSHISSQSVPNHAPRLKQKMYIHVHTHTVDRMEMEAIRYSERGRLSHVCNPLPSHGPLKAFIVCHIIM